MRREGDEVLHSITVIPMMINGTIKLQHISNETLYMHVNDNSEGDIRR